MRPRGFAAPSPGARVASAFGAAAAGVDPPEKSNVAGRGRIGARPAGSPSGIGMKERRVARDDRQQRTAAGTGAGEPQRGPAIHAFGRRFPMPRTRGMRIASGSALILGGILGFLPVLGFWMIPSGLLVLSYDIPSVRRWRRRMAVWWHRRRGPG